MDPSPASDLDSVSTSTIVGGVTTVLPVSDSLTSSLAPSPLLTPAMPAPSLQPTSRSRRVSAADVSSLIPARRSSTRSIKRKKFDDELVESSLFKTERPTGRPKTGVISPAPSTGLMLTPVTCTSLPHSPIPSSPTITSVGGVSMISSAPVFTAVSMATSHSQTVLSKTVTDDSKDIKPIDPIVKPPPEKRSKPASGKSVTSVPAKVTSGKGVNTNTGKMISTKTAPVKVTGGKIGLSRPSHSKKSKNKRSRKSKSNTPALKDLGRWKPQDDLALITAVQQTNDLSVVHTGVKFSCRFTLKEIQERWHALLYDQSISKIAMEAARQLHSDTVATIQGKALYSNGEEKLLATFTSTSQPTLENFQSLLQQHPDVFHPARSAKTLHCHWLSMKQYHLLPDQTVLPMPREDHVLNLSDIEDFMNDDEIKDETDDIVEQELSQADRRNKREIRHLENEMPKWQVLVDSVTGISMPDFDNQTLGVLRGRLVRYLMRSREISLGRATKDNHVDVDLSLEGPAWKVSRRQGIIKLRNSGEFYLANEGKRPILVDGKPVMAGMKQKLNNNSVVEISCLRFTFLINMDVINTIRADITKTSTTTMITSS